MSNEDRKTQRAAHRAIEHRWNVTLEDMELGMNAIRRILRWKFDGDKEPPKWAPTHRDMARTTKTLIDAVKMNLEIKRFEEELGTDSGEPTMEPDVAARILAAAGHTIDESELDDPEDDD